MKRSEFKVNSFVGISAEGDINLGVMNADIIKFSIGALEAKRLQERLIGIKDSSNFQETARLRYDILYQGN